MNGASMPLRSSRIFADKPLTALCYRTIVLKSLAVETKDFLILPLSYVKRFQMSPFLAFTLKTDRFQTAPFSNLCVFISVFEQLRFCSQGKNGEILLRFHTKTEQCERGLNASKKHDAACGTTQTLPRENNGQ